MMSIWAIIPVKPLNRAKSRLAGVLSPSERQQLAESMLRHVLGAIRTVPQVMGTLVISRDNRALSIAREYGARTVQESGSPELNQALMRATQVVTGWKGSAVLILPADLPLITGEDITGIIELGHAQPSVVIATDQNENGTNALFIRPPGFIPYAYGEGSYRRHLQRVREAGVEAKVYRSERLLLDIDMPADLKSYRDQVQVGGLEAL